MDEDSNNALRDESLLIDLLLGRCGEADAAGLKRRLAAEPHLRQLHEDLRNTLAAVALVGEVEPPEDLVASTLGRLRAARQTEALLARLSDPTVAEQLTPLQRNQVPKLQRQLELEKPRYEKIKREYEELKASSEVFPKPEIVVAGIIYPGVSISLRGSQLRISDALKEAKYYLTADGEVAFVGEEAPEKELWREEPKASEPE